MINCGPEQSETGVIRRSKSFHCTAGCSKAERRGSFSFEGCNIVTMLCSLHPDRELTVRFALDDKESGCCIASIATCSLKAFPCRYMGG